MNNKQSARLVLWLLVFPGTLLAQAPETKSVVLPMFSADAARDQIELKGIMVAGGQAYAAISFGKGPARWMTVGENLAMYRIADIGENSVRFVGSRDRSEFTKHLVYGKPESPEADSGPRKYSKAWINSTANPMLLHATPLPMDVAMNWSQLDPKAQQEIIEYYVNHGWQLKVTTTENGITHGFAWDNIYEAERREVMRQNTVAFRDGLNEAQRATWDEIKSSAPFKAAGPGLTAEDLAVINYRRARFAKFKETLSDSQRNALENLSDFTRHDWSK
ncbi:MAG: hypothetical protein JSR48_08155 [Verrucomicrobia bacterium]|nr:hypothetical protein [Verrucomicrobiota bacterium]